MTDTLPDRLSNDPRSPYHNAELLERGIGIRFNGVERTNVEEYCVSEGWVRVIAGKALDRRGQPMTMKLKGKPRAEVEEFLRAFHQLVTSDTAPATKGLGDLILLGGVRKFPQRVKCAMLAWRAFEQALREPGGTVTTETDAE